MHQSTAMQLGVRRSAEMAAMFMIGDGLLGLLQARRHVELSRSEVSAADVFVRAFARHRGRRRAYGLLQIGAGLALASALTRRKAYNGPSA
jgi:hypothetical protein